MSSFNSSVPVVLSLAAHDPCGSAGIQADIETCMSLGCHCSSVITAICAKDTRELKEMVPVDSTLLIEQARAILEDMPVAAIKLGFLGSVSNVEAAHTILHDYPNIPVILDPLTSVEDDELLDSVALLNATTTLLLPMATLATPDLVEAHELAKQGDTINACASQILESGCQNLLITSVSRNNDSVENVLYNQLGLVKTFSWPRLKLFSHGSGATLSASIAAYLAHGLRLIDAVEQGQQFTWRALEASRQLGMGKRIPNRIFWAKQNHADKKTKQN
jgi:hydroxymethylpyrimidine/phosphomethylpyrimidine kinase